MGPTRKKGFINQLVPMYCGWLAKTRLEIGISLRFVVRESSVHVEPGLYLAGVREMSRQDGSVSETLCS